MNMNERKKKILWAVIKEYVETAEPVGSNILSQNYNLDISPATIRNEMVSLEEEGFLIQPYTSAGRIPTDKGYRFYVDYLMKMYELSVQEKKLINEAYIRQTNDLEYLMENTLKVLTALSSYLGVITGNEELLRELFGRMKNAAMRTYKEKLFFSGLSKLLEQPEFIEVDRVRSLIHIMEDKEQACSFFDAGEDSKDVYIRIGSEHKCKELDECSIVTKKFHYKNQPVGTVGLVGPKRMRYSQVSSTVKHITDQLDELLLCL